MKKFLMMMIALVFAGAANAQMATQNAKILDNTYVTVGGGVATPLDFYDVLPLNPTATIAVGKWFNPRVGAEIEGTAWFGSHDAKGTWNRWDHVNIHNIVRGSYVGLNGLINWSNVFAHYKGTPRLFEVNSIVGIGWAHTNRPGLNDKYSNCLGAKTGLDLAFNLGKKKANTLSVRPAVLWDLSHPGDGAGQLAFNKLGAQLQLGVAYTYHFKTSNDTHNFKLWNVGAMQDEIARLNDELAKKPKVVVKRQVVEKPVPVKEETPQVVYVFFAKNSAEITDFTALDTVKGTVSVVATASPEGTAEYNKALSQRRADAVKAYLEGRGVTVKKAEGLGVQGENSNRVAIVSE